MESQDQITYIGKVDHRNKMTKFGIKSLDRTKHMYIIGKTGTGKSTFLENMIVQDIQNGNGVAFIDPHGGSAERMLDFIPEWRLNDVIYFNPSDMEFPVAFNPLEDPGPEKRHLVSDGLMSVFKKVWPEAFSGRMEYILNTTMMSLLEYPDSTVLSINRMLTDKEFRKRVVASVTDSAVKNAWDELMKWDDKRWSEAVSSLINKVGQFSTNSVIRNIIGQSKSTFDFRKAMDEKKIIIINLSKGMIGEQNAPLLGAMLITKIYLAAMSRAELPDHVLKKTAPFYFYVDEFQNFANESFASILSEARKYKLCLTVANQFIAQMEETIRDAVFGNMGTTVSFRVGPLDAEFMERVFAPVFTQEDLQNIAFGQYYITLQIDGMGSKPFSAQGLGPMAPLEISLRNKVIEMSRANFARPKEEVEEAVREFFGYAKKDGAKTILSVPVSPNAQKTIPPHPSLREYQKNDAPRKLADDANPDDAASRINAPRVRAFVPRPPEKTQLSPKPLPAINPIKKDEPRAKPVKTSESLQSLLGKLDTMAVIPETKTEIKKEVRIPPKAPEPQKSAPTMPDPKMSRVATPEKKLALKDVLAKAMEASKTNGSAPATQNKPPAAVEPLPPAPSTIASAEPAVLPPPPPVVTPEAQPNMQAPAAPVPQPEKPQAPTYTRSQVVREIPEDILRQVLE